VRYDERLVVPRLWHLWTAGLTAIIASFPAAYVNSAAATIIVYAGVFAGLEVLLWLGGRASVRVGDGAVTVGATAVPLTDVTAVEVVGDVRSVLVPGRPAQTRPWVPRGVRLVTADGPGWVLSTRRPERLAEAIGAPVGERDTRR
jgi:Protein of unknown function (DUF3093)